MKEKSLKKFSLVALLCLIMLLITGCYDEVLSVVTCDKSGKKTVHNYISSRDYTVYDEDISLNSWQDVVVYGDSIKDAFEKKDLIFKIENKKENVVVLGDEFYAVEMAFFEGGCTLTIFSSINFDDSLLEYDEEE